MTGRSGLLYPFWHRQGNVVVIERIFAYREKRARLHKLFQPVRESKYEIIEGESPEAVGVNLAVKLREAKVL